MTYKQVLNILQSFVILWHHQDYESLHVANVDKLDLWKKVGSEMHRSVKG